MNREPYKILFSFATEMEKNNVFPNGFPEGSKYVITGVGLLNTSLCIAKELQRNKYDLAAQIGIAGAYKNSNIELGSLVEIKSDCLLEFMPWKPSEFFQTGNIETGLTPARAATVLHCTDSDEIATKRSAIAQVESMEGAAFFAACAEYETPSVQIRGISNIAAKYDKSLWQIDKATQALREFCESFDLFRRQA